ncbi:Ff.00g134850.m01.CDS01 [Fusarium sp. VM40]|nr:Ff.00g134850.m01.CDS01 [Fusarium sp. VM40]
MSYTPDASVLSSLLITFSLATILLVCRLVSRKITHVSLWWDDYFAMASWFAASLYFSFAMYWTFKMGLGHAKEDLSLPAESVEQYARFGLFMAELLYATSLGFSKLAILGFYWRLFSVSNIRLGIYILQGSTVIWLTIRTFMTIFHCVPVEAYWNHNIKNAVCNVDPAKFMFGTTLVHLFLEIAVLSLPVFQVKSLKLRMGQKIAVVAMFMFGIFVCGASITVLVEAITLDPKTREMARDIKGVIIWAGVEANLAIISSCLPIIRPIFRSSIFSSILSSKSNSTGPNAISGLTSSKGIRLNNITRTKETDDNSSQRQLADLEDGSSGDVDLDVYAERSGYNRTIITTCADEGGHDDDNDTSRAYGIQVKNETKVYYEST